MCVASGSAFNLRRISGLCFSQLLLFCSLDDSSVKRDCEWMVVSEGQVISFEEKQP